MSKSKQTSMTPEEQKAAYQKAKKEHEQRLKADPKYRQEWEKTQESFQKIALLDDSWK